MRSTLSITAAAVALLALSAAHAAAQPPAASVPLMFASGDGAARGTGSLTAGPTGVMVRLALTGLAPGWHAIHFHAVGDCSDAKLVNSGAHIQMIGMKAPHGLLNPAGPDAGDLPNVWADASGAVNAEVFSSRVSLHGEGGRPALLDADGSALIVHAAADDGVTQPIGGAGARVACGVIKGG